MTKTRILFANDERVIADTAVMILNRNGYEAIAVYSGEAALELAPSFKPDILISDIIMCDANGIETAILIHDMLPDTRILLHDGWYGVAYMLENAMDRGYEFDFLACPFHPQDLLNVLANLSSPQEIFKADRIRNPPRPAMRNRHSLLRFFTGPR